LEIWVRIRNIQRKYQSALKRIPVLEQAQQMRMRMS